MNLMNVSPRFSPARHPAASLLLGDSRPDLLRDDVLPDIFNEAVERGPDRTAYITPAKRFSYRDIDEAANALAAGLQQKGIGPGDVVGLWFRRGVALLTAQIAITRSGAAWLPFDADTPAERINACLSDADARGILTEAHLAPSLDGLGLSIFVDKAIALRGQAPANPRSLGLTADHAAYYIYTSGSTGTPKGIEVTHRNICHFLRAAREVYGVNEQDIVFQGASAAFDLSMEEIWLPYVAGASLFVADPAIMSDIEALPGVLRQYGVTVIDTVPTLLSLFSEDVPSLRIIILGGEACPPSIAARFARPGRQLFNSYGPTEATVVATVAEILPGADVTIGRPIPNYSCYVVNEALELVAEGSEGELLIGGPGIARGYLKRPDLTAAKFIANPFPLSSMDPVLYRTGDAVSVDADGNIRFHGRLDDQVKIRGFRVELGEIEARLSGMDEVLQAAVVLRSDNGVDQLVAFIVPAAHVTPDVKALRAALALTVPAYMVPARIIPLDHLPVMVSGKTDRKALMARDLPAPEISATVDEERTPTEAVLHAAAQKIFPGSAIPLDADFFTDLGGHSLLAARFISIVREKADQAGLGLQDVYRDRTIRAMAARLDAELDPNAARVDLTFTPVPLLRRFLCGAAQAAALPVIISLMTAQWLGVFVSYMLLNSDETPFYVETLSMAGVFLAINLLTTAIVIGAKWLILGRTRPGRYPLWGSYYYRWWLVQRLTSLIHMKWVQGTPLLIVVLRLLGARIGKDTLLYEVEAGAVDLLDIGNGVSIGGHCGFANAQVIGNELVIGPITIGDDAYIGSSCVIGGNVTIGESAEMADLTAIGNDSVIGAFEKWDGSPARRVGTVDVSELPAPATASRAVRARNILFYLLAALTVPSIGLMPLVPAFYIFDWADGLLEQSTTIDYHWFLPLIALPAALSLVAMTVASIVAIRWIFLPRLEEGTYSVHSGVYVRKWIVSLASEVALETLSSLYATVYMRGWYRLMGAKIGKGAEISTSLSGRYDLVEVGANCFIADEAMLGEEDVRRGWMTLKKVRTGDRVFVGNNSVVGAGADIPTGTLIGIKSKPPANELMSENDTWFGSPSIKLPVRQRFDGGANRTFTPSIWRQLGRAGFEAFFNLSVPTVSMITFGTVAIEIMADPITNGDYLAAAGTFVALGLGMSVTMTLIVIGLKWLMMGTYVPREKPMWSWWALRTEAIAVMYSGMAARMLLDFLRGTPFLPWLLRLFGAKFGKGVYLDMTDITEFDCINVGDYVSVNAFAALQTHLYEDRVMKIGRVSVGKGVSVECGSTVLYDSHVGDFARLGPLTIVMKGERIPANSEWHGAPATRRQALAGKQLIPVALPRR